LGWRVNTKRLEHLWWRVLACVAGLHESHTLFCREAETERQAVTCGFVDPPSPEEMTALRSAPSSGVLIPVEPNVAHLKRLMREVAHYFTPGYRLHNTMPSTHSGAVYDLLAEAEKQGWLKPPRCSWREATSDQAARGRPAAAFSVSAAKWP
jgi:hypothetical protein